MVRWRQINALIAILAAGAILRGLYLAEIAGNPDFRYPAVDAGYHDYWARSLVTGNWTPPLGFDDPQISSTPYLRPPGYPYFLALAYLFTNLSYTGVRIVQIGLGLLNCLLAYLLSRRRFNGKVGLIAAAAMSFYWIFIYYEGELLEPVLLVTLGLALVYAVSLWTDRISFRRSLGAGVLLGLFALVRPNVLLFGSGILAWSFWVAQRRRDPRFFRVGAIGLAVGAVLAIAPAAVRNYLVAHDFVPISSNLGVNLFLGNNQRADGLFIITPEIGRFGTCYDYPQVVRSLEKKLGRSLKHSQVSAYFADQAWQYIKANPGRTAQLIARKALLFLGPDEVSHNKEESIERNHSRVLRSIPGNFAMVLSLFVLGALMLFRDLRLRRDEIGEIGTRNQYEVFVLMLLFIGLYSVSFLPFFVAAQYRVPIIPFLLLFGSYAGYRLGQFIFCRNVRQAACSVVLLAILYALASRNYAGYEPDLANWHYLRGVAYDRGGRIDLAAMEYTTALRMRPNWVELHNNLGTVLARQGRTDEAVKHYSVALRINPSYIKPLNNLGVLLDEQGKTEEALRVYRAVLRVAPDNAATHNNLAVVFYFKGQYADAWKEIKLCRMYGGRPESRLLELLSQKMPEP